MTPRRKEVDVNRLRLASLGCALLACAACSARPTADDRRLVAEAEALREPVRGTPGQEHYNRLNTAHVAEAFAMLKGDRPGDAAAFAASRIHVRRAIEHARKGLNWPAPPLIHAPRAVTPPAIDGNLDDDAWRNAAIFDRVYPFNGAEPVATPGTRWLICWDRRHLYVAFDCEDADLIAPSLARDEAVYKHDCVEVFLLPRFDTGVLWELVVSPSGAIYDALRTKWFDQWGSAGRVEQQIEGLRIGVAVRGTLNSEADVDDGYTVELALPFDQLPEYSRTAPEAGETLHIMLVRLDADRHELKPYAFIPLLGSGHNIWNHATVRLVGPGR